MDADERRLAGSHENRRHRHNTVDLTTDRRDASLRKPGACRRTSDTRAFLVEPCSLRAMMLTGAAAAGRQLRIRVCGGEERGDQPQAENSQQQDCEYAPQTASILRI